MKKLLILFSVIISSGCKTTKQQDTETITIEYSAVSRGTYLNIKINDGSISVQNNRKSKPVLKVLTSEQWNSLLEELKTIDRNSLSILKAPSQKRYHDGAAIAKLKITYSEAVYEVPNFDHGDPHSHIALLIKQILSLTQNIEKQ